VFILFPPYLPYLIDDGAREMDPEVQREIFARTVTLAGEWDLADRVLTFDHELDSMENVERIVEWWAGRRRPKA
jgi:hypothetical protein